VILLIVHNLSFDENIFLIPLEKRELIQRHIEERYKPANSIPEFPATTELEQYLETITPLPNGLTEVTGVTTILQTTFEW
jgi:hypothetical protein